MNLEDRLSKHLKGTGDGLATPPTDVAKPLEIVGRRQRRRNIAKTTMVSLLLVGFGVGAYRLTSDQGAQDVVAADEVAADTSSVPDSDADSTAPDPDEGGSGGTGDDTPPAPDLMPTSTGPILAWSELELAPDVGGAVVSGPMWSGSHFVALVDDGTNSFVIRSGDGSNWDRTNYSSTDDPFGLFAEGETLVVWGGSGPSTVLIAMSQDSGETWTQFDDVEIDAPPATVSPHLIVLPNVSTVASKDDVVVAFASYHATIDVAGMLEDQGIDYPEGLVEAVEAGQYSIEIADSSTQLFVCLDLACSESSVFDFDELGLSTADQAALLSNQNAMVTLRSVGGGPFETVDGPGPVGFTDELLVADGEFYTVLTTEQRSELWASTDGLVWETRDVEGSIFGLGSDGTGLYAQVFDDADGEISLRRSDDGGRSWEPIEVESSVLGADIAVYGDHLVVAAQLSTQDPGAFTGDMTMTKDGYTVTWFGEDSMTLVDDSTGEVILQLGADELAADEPPETIVVNDSPDIDESEFVMTFLDPTTLEPLVGFTEAEMADQFGMEDFVVEGDNFVPDFIIGWSSDNGSSWGWQRSTEAFGLNGWAEVTLGDGVAIALVRELLMTPSISQPGEQQLFIASTN